MLRFLYVVFQFAWSVAFFVGMGAGLVQFGGAPTPLNETTVTAMAVGLGLAALGLSIAFRRDRITALKFAVFFTVIPVFIGFIPPLLNQPRPIALWLLVPVVLCFVAASVVLVRSQLAVKRTPSILRQRFGDQAVWEYEGVQFAIHPSAQVAGKELELRMTVQNCWSGKRTFGMDFETESKEVLFHRAPRIELEALEVGDWAMPVRFTATHDGRPVELSASPTVSGMRGKREVLWRARTAQRKVSGVMTAFALLGGTIYFGGGLRFTVNAIGPRRQGALPEPSWTSTSRSPAPSVG